MPQSMNRRSVAAAIGAAAVAIPAAALAEVHASSLAPLALGASTSGEAQMRRLWQTWLECWPGLGEAADAHDKAQFEAESEFVQLDKPWSAYSVDEHRERDSDPFRVTHYRQLGEGLTFGLGRDVLVAAPDMLSALRIAKANCEGPIKEHKATCKAIYAKHRLAALEAAKEEADNEFQDAKEAIIAAPTEGPLAIAVKLAIFLLFDADAPDRKRAVMSVFHDASRAAGVDLFAEAAPYGFPAIV
jgi:hypothetical protein